MPAMPSKAEISNSDEAFAYQLDHGSKFQFPGLTKREMFAMHIMANIAWNVTDRNQEQHYQYAATSSVKMADALLAELEKQQ